MSDRPSDEVVDAMIALCRDMACLVPEEICHRRELYAIARDIVAELPKPVDPVVLACREIVADAARREGFTAYADGMARGDHDRLYPMQAAIAAYRAGQASC